MLVQHTGIIKQQPIFRAINSGYREGIYLPPGYCYIIRSIFSHAKTEHLRTLPSTGAVPVLRTG